MPQAPGGCHGTPMGYFIPPIIAAGVGLYLFLAVSVGIGLSFFVAGLSAYREYRLVESIPEMPLRSIAMGLVRVRGKAQGDELLTSPLTRPPCFYYKVMLGERRQNFAGQSFWARGYFVSTVGRDETTIREYIRSQEQEDQRIDQMNLWR